MIYFCPHMQMTVDEPIVVSLPVKQTLKVESCAPIAVMRSSK